MWKSPMPMLGSTAVLLIAVVSGAMSTSVESPGSSVPKLRPTIAFCVGTANLLRSARRSACPENLRGREPTSQIGSHSVFARSNRCPSAVLQMAASTATTGFELRKEPTRVGGVGRFLRTPDVLQLIIDDKEENLQGELLPALQKTLTLLEPKEKKLAELQRKYDETENEVFGSQILPLEVSMRELVEIRNYQQGLVDESQSEIAALIETRKAAIEKFQSQTTSVETLAGRKKKIEVPFQRSFAFGPKAEAKLDFSGGDKGEPFKLQAEWGSKQQELPVFIEADTAGGLTRGLVVGFGTPEEGPRRLSAVAEWRGLTDSEDIQKRKQALIDGLVEDGLEVLDEESTRVSFEGDAVPFRRFNELWLTIGAPSGIKWYDHAAKIATDEPAKNSSIYSIKDCVWAAPRAWLDPEQLPAGKTGPSIAWSASSGLSSNSLTCSLPAPPPGLAIALDHASSGELALSFVQLEEEAAAAEEEEKVVEEEELYAVAPVSGWPLARASIEKAQAQLLSSLRDAGYKAVDEGSFRVLVRRAREAEVWMLVAEQ